MTDPVCPGCGHTVLAVATRCPHCGLPFETQFYQHPSTGPKARRISPAWIVAGVAVTLVVANALRQQVTLAPRTAPRPGPTAPTPRAEPPSRPPSPPMGSVVASESLPEAPAPSPEPPRESPGPVVEPARPAVSQAAGVDTTAGLRRYASTWMHVRAGRSGTAPVLRVLRPGEAVQVDSLRRGWYRLVSGEAPLGYVDGGLLDSVPPEESP